MRQNIYFRYFAAFVFLIWPGLQRAAGQCSDWRISAQVTASSTCAASGSFTVSLAGSHAANLSGVQYGVPLMPNGFSVPLNSSNVFSNMPPGTYTVSAVALCNGAYVGRNTTITVPGSYSAPSLTSSVARASLNCASTGMLNVTALGGAAPFTYTLTAAPAAYTGPRTVTGVNGSHIFRNLPPGTYTVQAVDACFSGTLPRTETITGLNPAVMSCIFPAPVAVGCDTLEFPVPWLNHPGYVQDTSFKVSIRISNLSPGPSPYIPMRDSSLIVRMPAGKKFKDYYGETITYTIQPPCGPSFTRTMSLVAPTMFVTPSQNCNIDFIAGLRLNTEAVCLPITYMVRNTATQALFGPFTATTSMTTVTPSLPLGSYMVSFRTGDGYTDSQALRVNPVTGNPYSVRVLSGAVGLHNYIEGFVFTSSAATLAGLRSVELFSGPAGYTFRGTWSSNTQYPVYQNSSPTPSTVRFPPGTYVWKITDNCGTYYLTVTVGAQDLYQFTVGPPIIQDMGCQGILITPTGSAASQSSSTPLGFSLLLNGSPLLVTGPSGISTWPVYPAGTPIVINTPGTYTIVPSSGVSRAVFVGGYYAGGSFYIGYPNIYTASYTFTYTQPPLQVDLNATQGYLCPGAGPGQARITAGGKGGILFQSAPGPHYQYSLALPGNGASGPYIATNNTGNFSGFGGNANAFFDLKVVDSCGAFAVQPLKILDLGTARLISATKYSACMGDTVQLSAIYLPGSTYAWTGPNGFSSTLRQPVIRNLSAANTGVYRVTITTTACNAVLRDSTIVTANGNPPKPLISHSCLPLPMKVMVTNPATGMVYQWDVGRLLAGPGGPYYFHGALLRSDSTFTKWAAFAGSYAAVALDTITGCTTSSDSLVLNGVTALNASIYSPHLLLCSGDSTILVAQGYGAALKPHFQWYRNGTAIPGATGFSYTTAVAGSYTVRIETGICSVDTSAPANVTIVTRPMASLTASDTSICQGDTAYLQAAFDTSYTYNWSLNGTTIPGAFSAVYGATASGSYTVTVANGGCIANAGPAAITVHPSPDVNLIASDLALCPGDSISISTSSPGANYSYTWMKDGAAVPGATGRSMTVYAPGSYHAIVATPQCPGTRSDTLEIIALPGRLELGNDTVVCQEKQGSLTLTAPEGFDALIWSSGETGPMMQAPIPGTYWLRATNRCGTFTDTIRIYSRDEFRPSLPDDTTICNGGGKAVVGVPALLQGIRWSTGATTSRITIETPGLYWVSGQSPCGPVYDTMRVAFCKPVVQGIALAGGTICEGDCIRPAADSRQYPREYTWSFEGGVPAASTLASPGLICYPAPGRFAVKLVVRNPGGADSLTEYITVSAKPVPLFRDTAITVHYKSIIHLPACAPAEKADWYIGDSLICRNCPELKLEARYYLNQYRCVVSNGVCPDSCSYVLRVIDIPHEVWMPNAFTPNHDGRNDVFRIITDNPNVQVVNLDVYNRRGQRVFTSNLNNGGWDGTHHGKPAAMETYYWQLRYRILDNPGQTYHQKGSVELMR